MKLKDLILEQLTQNSSQFISGQELAQKYSVTRAAVWKAIKSLEKSGVKIEAVTNRGYRIAQEADEIDVDFLKDKLEKYDVGVIKYETIDSTNDEAKRLSLKVSNNQLIIADEQTNGRGRRGRDFFSPKHTGLYMSILYKDLSIFGDLASVTGVVATAVAVSIDDIVFDNKDTTRIKWVNDIFVNNLKVSGILSELITCIEDEEQSCLIVGIGINIFNPRGGFPDEIKKTAGYLLNNSDNRIRSKLALRIYENIQYYMNNKDESVRIYRDKSNLIGSYVKINCFKKICPQKRYAYVKGITDDYHLLIEYEDGKGGELSNGEVSVVRY